MLPPAAVTAFWRQVSAVWVAALKPPMSTPYGSGLNAATAVTTSWLQVPFRHLSIEQSALPSSMQAVLFLAGSVWQLPFWHFWHSGHFIGVLVQAPFTQASVVQALPSSQE